MKRGAALLLAAAIAALSAVATSGADGGARVDVTQEPGPVSVNGHQIANGLPRLLSHYGFFSDLAGQAPAYPVTEYRLNTPLFSDGAEKLRFVYVPGGEKVSFDEAGRLQFPVGSALIKTFAFGKGADRRLIETRVLLHRTDGWIALPYRWNEEQTDATLVVAGAREDVVTPSGEAISYRIPNKNQCKECHGQNDAVVPIGPRIQNLHPAMVIGLTGDQPQGTNTFPVWEHRADAPVDAAARAYLDVNCAHCHRPGSTASNSGLDLRWEQDDPQAIGLMKRPVAAGRGSGNLLFDIVPGEPEQSILLHRMASPEPGVAMPELGKSTIDHDGVEIVRRWIAGMPAQTRAE
ncbi:SO2930 family diheme c-type cytochrome [Erythrobacter sp. HKB08]|uniref:SO2930 family diheme c-type cytochrome n=1 Tax=Erythrobacter sp. HKB08 TaxID=2502843 RepID=UPI001F2EAC7A|nr:SO2930 family diheme c-type cytochrome [Erythrobacter sp. HKB08]